MIAIKNTQKITFTGQLETLTGYPVVGLRDFNQNGLKNNFTAIIRNELITYELDQEGVETDVIASRTFLSDKAISPFTEDEIASLMIALNANITDINSYYNFQAQVLLYLANRDQYFGLAENWEIV